MFIISYILEGLAVALGFGLTLFYWVLFVRIIISWINPDPLNPIVSALRNLTDPVLVPFRNLFLPLTLKINIDLSPLLVFFLIALLKNSLVGLLLYFASLLR